jgi:steroid 5-alpha reductase family enzyme
MSHVAREPRLGRVESFALVVLAYVVALAAALWMVAPPAEVSLRALFLADVLATFVVFGFSLRLDNGSVYDPYWSVVPPLIALYWVGHAAAHASGERQLVVTALVFAWGIRLTYNWARGWGGLHHEDWRYVDLYARGPKWLISLFGIHLFPTIQVFLGCLALLPALGRGAAPWNALDGIALIVTAGAILIETVADEQLRRFAKRGESGAIMAEGLWAWSRHPNYFGELSFWWGLFLFALAADGAWWTVVGPLAMTLMFWFASIPMLDRRSLERRPGYAAHMARVGAIVPWFPRTDAEGVPPEPPR